jgi:hypothetical protein
MSRTLDHRGELGVRLLLSAAAEIVAPPAASLSRPR